MKILMVSDVFFPRVNGVSTSIQTFKEQLVALGHEVHMIAPAYHQETEPAQNEAWITRIPSRTIYFDPEDRLMRWRDLMGVIPKLKLQQFDVLHIHTPFLAHYAGLKLAKALNIPAVETYHTFFEDYLHHYLPWIPTPAAKWLARGISKRQCQSVDLLVSPSQPMLDTLREYGIATPAEVIPTGMTEASFVEGDGAWFRQKYDIPSGRPMLLYVGRVAFEKNIHFLIEMVQLLKADVPDVLLVITGEGPAEESLKHKVQQYDLSHNVRFLGYLDRATELNACYHAADLFVFASKSETQGLVLLEAMAQGTPSVAIAELGTASILVEGDGAYIANDDEVHFAQRVHSLLIDHDKRKKLGERAKAYVQEKWTAQAQAEKLIATYTTLLAKTKNSSKI